MGVGESLRAAAGRRQANTFDIQSMVGSPSSCLKPKELAEDLRELWAASFGVTCKIVRVLTDLWFRSSGLIVYLVGSLCFLFGLGTWFSLLFGPYCSEIVPKSFQKAGKQTTGCIPFSAFFTTTPGISSALVPNCLVQRGRPIRRRRS